MSKPLSLLLALAVLAVSVHGLCDEYIECMASARIKQQQCASLEGNGGLAKIPDCEKARDKHTELNNLIQQKNSAHDKCISEKAATAQALTGKKKEKCDKVAASYSAATTTSPVTTTPSEKIKRALSKGNKGKVARLQHRACLRDSRQQRAKCAALAKCCPAVKTCENDNEFKTKIAAIRKDIRDHTRECRKSMHKKLQAKRINARKQGKKGQKKQDEKTTTTAVPTTTQHPTTAKV